MKDYLRKYLYYYHFDPAKALQRSIESNLFSNLDYEGRILDLACGDGIFASNLISDTQNVYAFDLKLNNIKKARKENIYSGLVVGDARKICFKNKVFDLVLINSFLEHIFKFDMDKVFLETNKILKSKAKIYLTVNSKTLGQSDPLGIFFNIIKLKAMAGLWNKYKKRRLALYSLNDYSYWERLFHKAGFIIIDSKKYLAPQTEKKFFLWTELQYIGISRVNLGSVIRLYSKILDFLGIKWHRKIISNIFSKVLKKYYVEEKGTNQGSCIFFVLEKEKDVSINEVKLTYDLGAEEYIALSDDPSVSVVIPSLDGYRGGNLPELIEDLKRQNYQDFEIHVVKGIKPQGKAINIGTNRAKGDILVVLDDDTRVNNPSVLGNLVKVVKEEPIGMAGASIMPPPGANWLQKRAGAEFPRFGMHVVDKVTESDMACHGCCAFRKEVFEEVGRERENILRGLDPDLRVRLRNAGYRVVMAPNSWVYHPLPGTLLELLRTFFRNGMGSAYAQRYQPELIYDTDETLALKDFQPKKPFIYRIGRFPLRLLKSIATFKFLRFMAYTVYAVGYFYGYIKYSIK